MRHGCWWRPRPTTPGRAERAVAPLDIWRAAKLLVNRHGDQAPGEARVRAMTLRQDGDGRGAVVRQRIHEEPALPGAAEPALALEVADAGAGVDPDHLVAGAAQAAGHAAGPGQAQRRRRTPRPGTTGATPPCAANRAPGRPGRCRHEVRRPPLSRTLSGVEAKLWVAWGVHGEGLPRHLPRPTRPGASGTSSCLTDLLSRGPAFVVLEPDDLCRLLLPVASTRVRSLFVSWSTLPVPAIGPAASSSMAGPSPSPGVRRSGIVPRLSLMSRGVACCLSCGAGNAAELSPICAPVRARTVADGSATSPFWSPSRLPEIGASGTPHFKDCPHPVCVCIDGCIGVWLT